ncbi:MAG: esterase/lipase family protein [Mycobacterium leprae]
MLKCNFTRKLAGALGASLLLLSLLSAPRTAEASATRTLEATYTSVSNGWVKVERWQDGSSIFTAENYPLDGRGDQDGQRLTFFNNVKEPASSRFLLYYAPGWDTGSVATPVLLVHGANDNADRAWANPNEMGGYGCGASTCPSTGLMQYLSGQGYKVFAINFAQKQGDNYFWSEEIYDAIQIIKQRTGASTVDVIGWSKGAFAARMYVSSVRKTGGTAYASDVRKLLLLGGPNGGYDYPFRHGWQHDFSIYSECGGSVNAPSPHTAMVCYGAWATHPELSIYTTSTGNFFPGQKQMLARWDQTYALPTTDQDYYTTYYGGNGYYTKGDGIDAAIQQGSLVSTIVSAGIPSAVSTYLLCGDTADIPTIHNEHTGPSDGVVFIKSCQSTTGIGTVSANVLATGLNHLKLGWATSAESQIATWLGK